MIASIREWLYKGRLLKSTQLPAFTVSVGNISMGGTGKSPFVAMLAEMALAKGLSVAVLSRGYKRKSKKLEVVKAGAPTPPVQQIGDEPWMIRNRLPGIALLVHRNRARMAARHYKDLGEPSLLILDDGFQHWRAVRDRDVLMVDVAESLDQFSLPFGKLREGIHAAARADLIVLTRARSVEPQRLEQIKARLRSVGAVRRQPIWKRSQAETVRIVAADYKFLEFFDGATGKACSLPEGTKFVLATGVAKPDGVRALAKKLGVEVVEEIYFPDHHRMNAAETDRLKSAVSRLGQGALLTTEKDWARWREALPGTPIFGMRVGFEFLGDGEAELKSFVEEMPCFI